MRKENQMDELQKLLGEGFEMDANLRKLMGENKARYLRGNSSLSAIKTKGMLMTTSLPKQKRVPVTFRRVRPSMVYTLAQRVDVQGFSRDIRH